MEENKVNEVVEEKKPSPFAGMKDQKGLKAKVKYFFEILEKYPEVREMVMFMLFSMLCGLGQMGSQFLLQYTLVLIPDLQPSFQWFVFTGESIAEFIGFMVGAIVGQTLTYILNRKKTFRATNNLALSIALYVIMAVGITILQTLIPGWITKPCFASYRANFGQEATGIIEFLITLTGTAVGGIVALITSFLGNKFVVMRDWSGKKKKAANETVATKEVADEVAENVED